MSDISFKTRPSEATGLDNLRSQTSNMHVEGYKAKFECAAADGNTALVQPKNENIMNLTTDSNGTCYLDLGDKGYFAKEVPLPRRQDAKYDEACFLRYGHNQAQNTDVQELYAIPRSYFKAPPVATNNELGTEQVTEISTDGKVTHATYKITEGHESPMSTYINSGLGHMDSNNHFQSNNERWVNGAPLWKMEGK